MSAPADGPGSNALAASAMAFVRRIVADVLCMDGPVIDDDAPLMQAGLTSQGAISLRRLIQQEFPAWHSAHGTGSACEVPATLVFDHPTLRSIAGLLEGRQSEATAAAEVRPAKMQMTKPSTVLLGVACRLPDTALALTAARSAAAAACDSASEVPLVRWDVNVYFSMQADQADLHNRTYSRHGGFAEGLELFDAPFFSISASEAATMDPGQRLLLETSCEAAAAADKDCDALAGSAAGVVTAQFQNDWPIIRVTSSAVPNSHAGPGIAPSIAANRLSYCFGLEGPSLTVDTACSSALMAADVAVSMLRGGRCGIVLVSAANLLLAPNIFVLYCCARMLSLMGRSRAFDCSADGYMRSDGLGAIVLATEEESEWTPKICNARGVAVNSDGRSASLTAPRGPAQHAVIRAALCDAAEDALDVLECHGTGTPLGDPVEASAARRALCMGRNFSASRAVLHVGSIKAAMGHAEGSAGLAGIVRACTVLERCARPALMPALHLRVMNSGISGFKAIDPGIDASSTERSQGLMLATEVVAVSRSGAAEHDCTSAGVSSFGFGGTNAHMVLTAVRPEVQTLETQVPSPAYQRRRFAWTALSHPLLDRCIRSDDQMAFSARLSLPRIWTLLCHHIIHDAAIVPAAAFLEMIAAALNAGAAQACGHSQSIEIAALRDVGFFTPLVVATAAAAKDKAIHHVELIVSFRADNLVVVSSRVEESLDMANPSEALQSRHCESVLLSATEAAALATSRSSIVADGQLADSSAAYASDFYVRAVSAGYTLGPRFQVVRSIRCSAEHRNPAAPTSYLARLEAAEEDAELGYLLHPAIIDGAIQLAGLAPHGFYGATATTSDPGQEDAEIGSSGANLKIPVSIRNATFAVGAQAVADAREGLGPAPPGCWAYAEVLESSAVQVTATIFLLTASPHASPGTTPLLSLVEMRERTAVPAQLAGAITKRGPAEHFFEAEWRSVIASETRAPSELGAFHRLHTLQLDMQGCDVAPPHATATTASAAASTSGALLIDLTNSTDDFDEVVATLSSLARVLTAVQRLGPNAPPVLVATAGCAFFNSAARARAPTHAGVWGLIRAARHELSGLSITVVDVIDRRAHRQASSGSLWADVELQNALSAAIGEEEVALVAEDTAAGTQWQTMVRRLVRHRAAVSISAPTVLEEGATTTAWAGGGAYLITGGLGGIGLEAAAMLCRAGAAELMLLSRSGRARTGLEVAEKLMRPVVPGEGVDSCSSQPVVSIVCCDIADSDAVSTFACERPDIGLGSGSGEQRRRGVIHAAGVLSDATLANLRAAHFRTAFRPKVLGAQNLRSVTLERLTRSASGLDFFCVFSSIVGVLGNPGQPSYAAANAAVDAQVEYWRRREDCPVGPSCFAVQWGPWGQVGMAVHTATVERQRDLGWRPIGTELGMALLHALLSSARCLPAGAVLAASFRWQCYLRHLHRSGVASNVFALLAADGQEGGVARRHNEAGNSSATEDRGLHSPSTAASGSSRDISPALQELCASPEALASELQAQIRAIARETVPGTTIVNDTPLMDLGMDSLSAVEFRNRLQRNLGTGVWVSNTVIFDYPTVSSITGMLCSQLLAHAGTGPSPSSVARQSASQPGSALSGVTVTSVSCHLAGCISRASKLRRLVTMGCDSMCEIPAGRWDVSVHCGQGEGQSYSRHGGFMEGLELFDPAVFGLAATEARSMDPGQRVLLEVGLDAMVSGGRDRGSLLGSDTGVAVAQTQHDWAALSAQEAPTVYTGAGVNAAISANRFSYTLGMRGASIVCDTACSSSLVGIDTAASFLQRGRCGSALAAAVNVMLLPSIYAQYSAAHMLSATGRCLTFSANGDGYARAEGVSAFFLTVDSEPETSMVYVAAIGINNDGRSASLTAPNGPAQQDVINMAMTEASMQPAELGLMECHGTGTALGDPIEVGALHSLHTMQTRNERPLLLASIKSHLGHAEAAAGASGLARLLVMVLGGGAATAPGLHLQSLNPNLPGSDPSSGNIGLAMAIAAEVGQEHDGRVRSPAASAVSSFGFGGTNAHLILRGRPRPSSGATRQESKVTYTRQAFPWRDTPDPLQGLLYELRWRGTSEPRLQLAAVGESAAGGDDAVAPTAEDLIVLAPASGSIELTGLDEPYLRTPSDLQKLRSVLPHGGRNAGRGVVPTMVFLRSAKMSPQEAALNAADISPLSPVLWELLAVVQVLCNQRQRAALIVATVLCPLVGLIKAPARDSRLVSRLGDAALWGMIRSFRLEAPWVSARLVDIESPSCCLSALTQVVDSGEMDVAFRGQSALIPRLIQSSWKREGATDFQVQGCHLITGGTGGVGLMAALALAGRGAQSLMLVSRRGIISPTEAHAFDILCNVIPATHRVCCDITDEEAARALAKAPERLGLGHLLAGVVHTAQAPLRYTDLASQTEERFLSEFSVRAMGAWNLHKATRELSSMGYFVCVSSLNSTMGQGSNAAISAGNMTIDGLVRLRGDAGLPGQTVQFSRVADVGSNAKNPLRYAAAISSIRELPSRVCEQFLKAILAAPGPPPPLLLADAEWGLLPDQIGQELSVLSDLATAGREAAAAAAASRQELDEVCTAELMPELPDLEALRHSQQPVAVVGGGFGGVMAARELLKRGLNLILFEREEYLGGSWRSLGNLTSRVQIERGTYNLNLDEPCPSTLSNYTSRDELMAYLDAFVLEHGIQTHARCSTEVVAVSLEGGSYRVTWQARGSRDSQSSAIFGAVMVFPGFLPRPRVAVLPGEAEYTGFIGHGLGDDIKPSAHAGQQVVVLGHGAFAVENSRTAVECGAKLVTQVCRRRNLVLPRVVSWLIDGAIGVDMDVEAVLRTSAPMYRLLGFDSTASAIPASFDTDTRGRRVLSQTNPAISDVYFLFQMTGHLEVLVGSVEAVRARSLAVRPCENGFADAESRQLEDRGQPLREIPCGVIVKCLGWDHSAHAYLDKMLGIGNLRGFWIDGDPRRFFFKFSSSSRGARGFNTLSFSILHRHALAAFFYFLARPAAMAAAADGLPTMQTLAEDLGTTFVGQSFLALASTVAALRKAGLAIDALKAQRISEAHPADSFIQELSKEWAEYQSSLMPHSAIKPYPYTVEFASALRDEVVQSVDVRMSAAEEGLEKWVIFNAPFALAAALSGALGSRAPAGGIVCVAPPAGANGAASRAAESGQPALPGVVWIEDVQESVEEFRSAAQAATVVAICESVGTPALLPSSLLRLQAANRTTRVTLVTFVGGSMPTNARKLWQQWDNSLQIHRAAISAAFNVDGNVSLLDLSLDDGMPGVGAAVAGEMLAQHLPRVLDERLERAAARENQLFRLQPTVRGAGVLEQSGAGPSLQDINAMVLEVAREALGGGSDVLTGDTPLLDAGLDSLGQIDLRQSLGRSIGPGASRLLTAAALFDHPTVCELAHFLHENLVASGDAAPTRVEASASQPVAQAVTVASQPEVMSSPLVSGEFSGSGDMQYDSSVVLDAPAAGRGSGRGCGMLVPDAWVQRPRRVLFLHGARADADVTLRVLRATGWIGRLKDAIEFALVDAPHDDQADASMFEGLIRLGWYDASGTYRLWNLPREELGLQEAEEDASWSASLEVIQDAWEMYGPFDGLAGMCEGAAAAALAALTPGLLEPKPRFLLLINGYASDHARYHEAYTKSPRIPALHLVGDQEDTFVKEFAAAPCWEHTLKRQESIPGRHTIPELTEELEESVRAFLTGLTSARRRKIAGHAPLPLLANQQAQTYLRLADASSRTASSTAPRLVLIIFPHAGGSALQFDALSAAFPADIAVWHCEYPGHGERSLEPALRSMRTLVRDVREELVSLVSHRRFEDAPLIFFGHSMGSVVMTLLAESLFADGPAAAQPVAMIASGRGPPHAADTIPRVHLLQQGTEDFVSALRLLSASFADAYQQRSASSQAVRDAATLIQDDFAACFEEDPWPPLRGAPWPILLVVMYGEDDLALHGQATASSGKGSGVPPSLCRWQELSKSPVRYHALPGGHDYVQTCSSGDIVAAFAEAMSGTHLTAFSLAAPKQVGSAHETAADSSQAYHVQPERVASTSQQKGPQNAASDQDLTLWLREQIVLSIFHASPRTRQMFISTHAMPIDPQTNELMLSNDLLTTSEVMDVTFAELGLGSLEWLLIREVLTQVLEVRIPPQLVFKGPTVSSLADLLLPLLRGTPSALQKLAKLSQAGADTSATPSQLQASTSPPVVVQDAGQRVIADSAPAAHTPGESIPKSLPVADIGANVRLGQNVRFEGPICIRDGAVIKDNVTFGGCCEVGEFTVIGPHVQLGPNCSITMFSTLQDDVVLGERCEVLERAILRGPIRAGSRNQFQQFSIIGGHSQHSGVQRSGYISIGDDCVFEIGAVVLAPRGRDDGPQGQRPGTTQIGDRVYVHMRAEVSHDCVLEEDVDLVGEITGFVHVMKGAKVMKGAVVHQFSTVGTGSFVAMGCKVRYDVLPYCIFDENTMVLDRIALRRMGISSAQAEELEVFYGRHFSSNTAHYCMSVEEMLPSPAESHGIWYAAEIRRFFAIRARMRDQRMLSRFGSQHEPLAADVRHDPLLQRQLS